MAGFFRKKTAELSIFKGFIKKKFILIKNPKKKLALDDGGRLFDRFYKF